MAGNKYISNEAGQLTEVASANTSAGVGDANKLVSLNSQGVLDASVINSKVTSAGAGDSGKIPALDTTGKLDVSVLPTGIGADTQSVLTSESLAAGDLVNIWNNSGTGNVRKADANSAGKEAHGFVLSAFSAASMAVVYFEGSNTAVTGRTPGKQYLSTTAGLTTNTAPTGTGKVVQVVGFATAPTVLNFQSTPSVVLA